MQTVYVAGGNLGVSGTVLTVGGDENKNWVLTADGAKTYWNVNPLNTAASAKTFPNSNAVAGGGMGASGDYLKRINFNVNSNTNAAVYLKDGSHSAGAPDIWTGTTGAVVTAVTGTPLLLSTAFTCTTNQYVNRIISMTYIPTDHVGGAIVIKRKIVSHAAFTNATTNILFETTHNWPVGGVVTAWSIEHASSKEIVPFNQPVGVGSLNYGISSVNSGWIISVDSGVMIEAHGKFTV